MNWPGILESDIEKSVTAGKGRYPASFVCSHRGLYRLSVCIYHKTNRIICSIALVTSTVLP